MLDLSRTRRRIDQATGIATHHPPRGRCSSPEHEDRPRLTWDRRRRRVLTASRSVLSFADHDAPPTAKPGALA
jgi:hypothetical protein